MSVVAKPEPLGVRFGIEEIAQRLGIAPSRIREWINRGLLTGELTRGLRDMIQLDASSLTALRALAIALQAGGLPRSAMEDCIRQVREGIGRAQDLGQRLCLMIEEHNKGGRIARSVRFRVAHRAPSGAVDLTEVRKRFCKALDFPDRPERN